MQGMHQKKKEQRLSVTKEKTKIEKGKEQANKNSYQVAQRLLRLIGSKRDTVNVVEQNVQATRWSTGAVMVPNAAPVSVIVAVVVTGGRHRRVTGGGGAGAAGRGVETVVAAKHTRAPTKLRRYELRALDDIGRRAPFSHEHFAENRVENFTNAAAR